MVGELVTGGHDAHGVAHQDVESRPVRHLADHRRQIEVPEELFLVAVAVVVGVEIEVVWNAVVVDVVPGVVLVHRVARIGGAVRAGIVLHRRGNAVAVVVRVVEVRLAVVVRVAGGAVRVDLLVVEHRVAVGVGVPGIGPHALFLGIVQSVVVRIGERSVLLVGV